MTADEFASLWNDNRTWIESQTSGSTGVPKTIRLNKSDMVLSARATNAFFGLNDKSVFVCPMDFKYVGARMMYVRAVEAGGRLMALFPSNQYYFDGIADLLAIVPSQVDCLLNSEDILKRTRNVIIGGAPLDEFRTEALMKSGVNAYTTYGMTETASHVALAKVGDDIYKALPSISFEKDDRNCLVINAEGRINSRIVTNDMVDLISPTAFRWLGRIDNVINSGGIKIHPETVEKCIIDCLRQLRIPFKDVAVTGTYSAKWGETAVCIIAAAESAIDTALVESAVKAKLPDIRMCPRNWLIVNELPYTINGKVARSELRDLFSRKK